MKKLYTLVLVTVLMVLTSTNSFGQFSVVVDSAGVTSTIDTLEVGDVFRHNFGVEDNGADYEEIITITDIDANYVTLHFEVIFELDENEITDNFTFIDGVEYNMSNLGIENLDFEYVGNFDSKVSFDVVLSENCDVDLMFNQDYFEYWAKTINVEILVDDRFEFTSSPSNNNVCENEIIELTSTAPTLGTDIQWQVNEGSGFVDVVDNGMYSGSSNDTLIINNVEYSLNGYIYKCTAIVSGETKESGEATLTVREIPITDNIIGNPNPAPYETLTYMVANTSTSTYEWIVVGGAIASNNGNSVDIMWGENGFGSLKVVETAENGCNGDTVELAVTVNVNQINNENTFSIYPNPATNNIQLNLSSTQLGNTVKIFNINGKLIKQFVLNDTKSLIDLSQQSKGVYFVKLVGANSVSTQKLILE